MLVRSFFLSTKSCSWQVVLPEAPAGALLSWVLPSALPRTVFPSAWLRSAFYWVLHAVFFSSAIIFGKRLQVFPAVSTQQNLDNIHFSQHFAKFLKPCRVVPVYRCPVSVRSSTARGGARMPRAAAGRNRRPGRTAPFGSGPEG